MIGIVDYGVGNLFSLKSSLKYLGLDHIVSADMRELARCDRLILPGVGAFGDARAILAGSGMDGFLTEQAHSGKPLLGICLGMQLLLQGSEEFGSHDGLGLIEGRACPLKGDIDPLLKVPHMGWNSLHFTKKSELFKSRGSGCTLCIPSTARTAAGTCLRRRTIPCPSPRRWAEAKCSARSSTRKKAERRA